MSRPGAQATCDRCGEMVSARGLSSHQRGDTCKRLAFDHKMRVERGWTVPGIDVRGYGIPGEHGPVAAMVADGEGTWSRWSGGRRYAVWHPKWVQELDQAFKAVGHTVAHRRVWARARDDEEWRNAFIATAMLDLGAASVMYTDALSDASYDWGPGAFVQRRTT